MTKETFIATVPARYVQIHKPTGFAYATPFGTEYETEQSVTGYKMEIDLDSMIYDSFIRESGEWRRYSNSRKVADVDAFWQEVHDGHLVKDES